MKPKRKDILNSTNDPRTFKLLNYDFQLLNCQCCAYRAHKRNDAYYNHNSRSWKTHRKTQYFRK